LNQTQQQQQQQYNNSNQINEYDPDEGQLTGTHEYSEEPVDYDIYNRAINVSSPRLAGVEGETNPGIVRKKVLRRVEVPFTRQVKVPTQTVQIVPTTVETKVPVKKLVQVPGYKTVDETYTEYEEREAIREKEIWVKTKQKQNYRSVQFVHIHIYIVHFHLIHFVIWFVFVFRLKKLFQKNILNVYQFNVFVKFKNQRL
jgi:hypothetical protein